MLRRWQTIFQSNIYTDKLISTDSSVHTKKKPVWWARQPAWQRINLSVCHFLLHSIRFQFGWWRSCVQSCWTFYTSLSDYYTIIMGFNEKWFVMCVRRRFYTDYTGYRFDTHFLPLYTIFSVGLEDTEYWRRISNDTFNIQGYLIPWEQYASISNSIWPIHTPTNWSGTFYYAHTRTLESNQAQNAHPSPG